MALPRPYTGGMTAQPTLAQLRLFVAVADAGSFSEAAAELGMSQSSLSESVAALERALGHRLLRRSRAGVALTDAGWRAIEHARGALLAVGDLHLALAPDQALSGTLSVAAFRSLGMHLLAPTLAALRRAHPALQVRVLDAESDGHGGERLVQSGQADAGLIELPSAEPLLTWPLLQDEYQVVAPAGRGGPAPGWAELASAPLILPPADNTCHRRTRSWFAAHGVAVQNVSEVEEDAVILKMVEHGLGLTIMPRLAVEPLPAGLRALPLPEVLVRPLGVAVRPGRASLPHIAAFVSAIRVQAAALVARSAMTTTAAS